MIKRLIKRGVEFLNKNSTEQTEKTLLAIGAMLSKQQYSLTLEDINAYEFKVFSQFGDDGIIQFLIKSIDIENETFIEFGVENYLESNTRFLMMNNNWRGFIMDGSEDALNSLKTREWFWKYDLTYKSVFIDKHNINDLLADTGLSNIGLLHVDIDGNDYHILNILKLTKLNPAIIVMEYNAVFGSERYITVPYDGSFVRNTAHYSNLYFGASIGALNHCAEEKGYSLVCCNLAGNNAYFVRNDLLNRKVKKLSVEQAYKESKFREGRNRDGSLSYDRGVERYGAIKGLNVLNVLSNEIELL